MWIMQGNCLYYPHHSNLLTEHRRAHARTHTHTHTHTHNTHNTHTHTHKRIYIHTLSISISLFLLLCRIEIEGGREIPVLDGSALGWAMEIQFAGLRLAPEASILSLVRFFIMIFNAGVQAVVGLNVKT